MNYSTILAIALAFGSESECGLLSAALEVWSQLLERVCKRTSGEPGVEDFQLVVGRIEEYDAHANSLMGVDDLSFGREAPTLVGDNHAEERTFRERVQNVHITSLAAYLGGSCHYASLASVLGEFRHGDEGISRHAAPTAVRGRRIRL